MKKLIIILPLLVSCGTITSLENATKDYSQAATDYQNGIEDFATKQAFIASSFRMSLAAASSNVSDETNARQVLVSAALVCKGLDVKYMSLVKSVPFNDSMALISFYTFNEHQDYFDNPLTVKDVLSSISTNDVIDLLKGIGVNNAAFVLDAVALLDQVDQASVNTYVSAHTNDKTPPVDIPGAVVNTINLPGFKH